MHAQQHARFYASSFNGLGQSHLVEGIVTVLADISVHYLIWDTFMQFKLEKHSKIMHTQRCETPAILSGILTVQKLMVYESKQALG